MPREVVWFEDALACLGDTGLSEARKASVIMLLAGYVRNLARTASWTASRSSSAPGGLAWAGEGGRSSRTDGRRRARGAPGRGGSPGVARGSDPLVRGAVRLGSLLRLGPDPGRGGGRGGRPDPAHRLRGRRGGRCRPRGGV